MTPEGGEINSVDQIPEGYVKSFPTTYFEKRKFAHIRRDFPLRNGEIRPGVRIFLNVEDLIIAVTLVGPMVRNILGNECVIENELVPLKQKTTPFPMAQFLIFADKFCIMTIENETLRHITAIREIADRYGVCITGKRGKKRYRGRCGAIAPGASVRYSILNHAPRPAVLDQLRPTTTPIENLSRHIETSPAAMRAGNLFRPLPLVRIVGEVLGIFRATQSGPDPQIFDHENLSVTCMGFPENDPSTSSRGA